MKKITLFTTLLLAIICSMSYSQIIDSSPDTPELATDTVSGKPKILFIGNSYTYFNDMPEMVKSIADSKGDSIIVSESTHGGWSTFQLLEYQPTLNAIHSENWDYVILQEGGYLEVVKDFVENKPHTIIRLTEAGRSAFEAYRRMMTDFLE